MSTLKRCVAVKCYNSSSNSKKVSFFCFPKNEELCKRWLKNCGRSDLNVNLIEKSKGYYKLCSDHFETKWFTDSTKSMMKRNLNPVPTIFINNISNLLPNGSQLVSEYDILPPRAASNEVSMVGLDESLIEPSVEPPSLSTSSTKSQVTLDYKTIYNALLTINQETKLYDIEDICKLCMNWAMPNYTEILSDSSEASEIRQMCKVVVPKMVENCEYLPNKVCESCVSDLKTCYKLIEQFQKADHYLTTISKFSLYIDDEETAFEGEMHTENGEECLKPIPRGAMVMQLKNFSPESDQCKNNETDLISKAGSQKDTGSIQDKNAVVQTDYNMTSDVTVNQSDSFTVEIPNVIQMMPVQTENDSWQNIFIDSEDTTLAAFLETDGVSFICNTEMNTASPQLQALPLITTEQRSWQNNISFIYSNAVVLPSASVNDSSKLKAGFGAVTPCKTASKNALLKRKDCRQSDGVKKCKTSRKNS